MTGRFLAITVGLALANSVSANTSEVVYEKVVVTAERDNLSALGIYDAGEGVDSGKTELSKEAVYTLNDGSIDTTEMLKYIPNIQMDKERNTVSAENEQNIRPSDFTISGGNTYDNNIQIDGVGNNSVMDTQTYDTGDQFNVSGQTAQTLYVHPSLVESVEVYDSNISAEQGNFTGGVVNYKLKEPSDEFEFSANYGIQNDSLVHYKQEGDEGELGDSPDFTTQTRSFSVSMPLTEKLSVLAAYSLATSEAAYETNVSSVDSNAYKSQDKSENYLLKARYQFDQDTKLVGSLISSPYESEYSYPNRADSEQLSHSDGLQTSLEFSSSDYGFDWSVLGAYNKNNTSREAESTTLTWAASSAYSPDNCNSCTTGGWGDLDQSQEDTTFEIKAGHYLYGGRLNFGLQATWTKAQKSRPEDSTYYYWGQSGTDLNCNGTDGCYSDYAATGKLVYPEYEAAVDVAQQSLWTEFERQFGPVKARVGVRYDHDNFLNNHNVAPRLVAAWTVTPGITITGGANRYYSNSMVDYALREKYPSTEIYGRYFFGTDVPDWTSYGSSAQFNYSDSNLETPYSDELSLVLAFATPLDGTLRVKGLRRFYRDQFSADKDDDNSNVMSNDGESTYDSVALEWGAAYDTWYFSANATWSETHSIRGGDYYEYYNDDAAASEIISYNNQLMSKAALNELSDRQNFAAPITASLMIGKIWYENRAKTSLLASYRGAYESISNSDNDVTVDGVDYDEYEFIKYKSYLELNLNSRFQVYKSSQYGNAFVDLRINNLLDTSPKTSTSNALHYERGRSFWLGVEYSY